MAYKENKLRDEKEEMNVEDKFFEFFEYNKLDNPSFIDSTIGPN